MSENKYWEAWEKANWGKAKDLNIWDFMEWISQKHLEFRIETGKKMCDDDYYQEFCKWLGV